MTKVEAGLRPQGTTTSSKRWVPVREDEVHISTLAFFLQHQERNIVKNIELPSTQRDKKGETGTAKRSVEGKRSN